MCAPFSLSKQLRQCLTKEEQEALFKEHPRPDAEVCTVPKVDKYMTEYLGKQFPKDSEAQLIKIQPAILASLRPLAGSPGCGTKGQLRHSSPRHWGIRLDLTYNLPCWECIRAHFTVQKGDNLVSIFTPPGVSLVQSSSQ